MVLNTTNDVRQVLRLDSGNQNITDTEITYFLNNANKDLYNSIKRNNEVEKFRVGFNFRGEKRNTFTLGLNPLSNLLGVLINNETLNVANYSYDTTLNAVTINEEFITEGDEVTILYTPEIYKLAELYICAYNILVSTNLTRQGGETSSVLANIETKMKEYLKTIRHKVSIKQWY